MFIRKIFDTPKIKCDQFGVYCALRILLDIATVAEKNCDGNEKMLHTDTQKNG